MKVRIAVLALLLACGRSDEGGGRAKPALTTRRLSALPADTLWVRGGRKDDRILRYPEYLAHDAALVFASDAAAHQVVAFDQKTGETRWSTSTSGAGLRAPGTIAGLPGGGVAILDASGSLVVLDSRGKVRTTAALIDGPYARQICALSDSTFLLALLRQRLPLVIVGASGQTLQRLELPWRELRELAPMQTQLVLAGSSDGRCIAGLTFGGGLASIREGAVEWTTPYIEPIEAAPLRTKVVTRGDAQTTVLSIGARHPAVRDLSVDDSIIAVIFEGAERTPGSLIDEYDARTGAYRRTRTSERRVMGIQRNGDRAFFLAPLTGYPALIAISVRERAR
jgi:hypothetical protein